VVRTLRAVDDPLGSYLRVTRRDTQFLAQMLVDGRNVGTGLVADPALTDQQRDLWTEAHERGVETVLDPRSLDLSTPGGLPALQGPDFALGARRAAPSERPRRWAWA